jgi:dolichyl-phosphate beta-glucosyltransferase
VIHCSLVIPAYNEAHRIAATLAAVCAYLARQSYASEIIVVDDGSTDGTHAVVSALGLPGVRCVRQPANRGKGAAVRRGMLDEATGAYRVFFDADGSTPIEELDKVWPHFDAGADIVIGSRALPGSQVEVHQAWYRESMGRLNNVILRALGITRFHDTQCGFKAFSANACAVVFPRQTVERFSFDAELLYIAHKHGLRIDEIPVRWINDASSRLNPVSDATRMVWDLMTIRWKDLAGRYR